MNWSKQLFVVLGLTCVVTGVPPQEFLREPNDQTAKVGDHVTLPCQVTNKKGMLQWTRDQFGLGMFSNKISIVTIFGAMACHKFNNMVMIRIFPISCSFPWRKFIGIYWLKPLDNPKLEHCLRTFMSLSIVIIITLFDWLLWPKNVTSQILQRLYFFFQFQV